MLQYSPLASGSKGNCLVIRSPKSCILVDCGLGIRALEQRLAAFDLEIAQIDAVLITHEHIDHIGGLKSLLRRRQLPVICNMETATAIGQILREPIPCHLFTTYEGFEWNDLYCVPFSVSHDAVDPVGFRISCQEHHLGICTDLGFVSATIAQYLTGCHLLYIESNHDPELVHASTRPAIYKQRVLSRLGHLSNQKCAQLLVQLWHPQLEHIYLAHLSEECNRPELALETVQLALAQSGYQTALAAATQDRPQPMVGPQGVLPPRLS